MKLGLFQILVVLLIVIVLFWRGRVSETMGDVGKGIRSFRKGLRGDGTEGARIGSAGLDVAAADGATDKTAG